MKKSSSIFILFLALGVFGIITTEMGIIGVLPQVADRFHISASKAGWLVSIFAFIVAVSGPFLTLLASGINRKVILLLAVLMFAVSNAVYAYTAHFSVMLAFRIIPALCHPVFFSVALAAAARLVPAGQSGKAVTKVFSGITA
ncbi:MFS transporter, partial [Bacillus tropicus]